MPSKLSIDFSSVRKLQDPTKEPKEIEKSDCGSPSKLNMSMNGSITVDLAGDRMKDSLAIPLKKNEVKAESQPQRGRGESRDSPKFGGPSVSQLISEDNGTECAEDDDYAHRLKSKTIISKGRRTRVDLKRSTTPRRLESGHSPRNVIPELENSSSTMGSWRNINSAEGMKGPYYDPGSVRFFYGKRWADGMCDAMGKPWNVIRCAIPCFWPVTLASAASRARPLIYGVGKYYVQATHPMRMRIFIYLIALQSLLFLVGILTIICVGLGDVPKEWRAEEWVGFLFFVIGIPGPILWGMTHVAIRNRYRVKESPISTFLKAMICPCMFTLRVKRHVDKAQGFEKPKGVLQEALCAVNDTI